VKLEQPVASYGNPQIEDGHTRIANELLEAIIAFDFSKRQLKVVLFVIRKTYGYNKKTDQMSISQISAGTGLNHSATVNAVAELVELGVVSKQYGQHGQVIGLVKQYASWGGGIKTIPQYQNDTKGVSKQQFASIKTIPTKETTKNNTKDICVSILEYLNQQAGKRYKPTSANLKFISARLGEGFTEQDCITVIDNKVHEWLHTDMNKYLRPETLFNATKFSQYSGETPAPQKERKLSL